MHIEHKRNALCEAGKRVHIQLRFDSEPLNMCFLKFFTVETANSSSCMSKYFILCPVRFVARDLPRTTGHGGW